MERAELTSYALPLIKDCFTEVQEYCAQNPDGIIDVTSWSDNSTCKRLLTGGRGIQTAKGYVANTRSDFPNRCVGTSPDYRVGSLIDIRIDRHRMYRLLCVGKRQDDGNVGTPECSPVPIE